MNPFEPKAAPGMKTLDTWEGKLAKLVTHSVQISQWSLEFGLGVTGSSVELVPSDVDLGHPDFLQHSIL